MTGRVPRSVRWSLAVYRVLLLAYPERFRRRYGSEMVRLFRERLRVEVARSGARGCAGHWLGTLRDVVVNAPGERVEAWRAGRHERSRSASRAPAPPSTDTHRPRGERMNQLREDVRYALRTIARNPGFAAVVAITLGLGIGANTAIFSVVHGVLLRPLPYPEPDRLAVVWTELTRRNLPLFPVSPPDFKDYRDQATQFEAIAGVVTFPQAMTAPGLEPEQVIAGGVTRDFGTVLGVEPLLGRGLTDDDVAPLPPGVQPGAPGTPPNIAILSWGLWQRRFGGDVGVLGRTIEVGGAPASIVGVMPREFQLLAPPAAGLATDVDIWLAMRLDFAAMPRGNAFLRVIGRLSPGITVAQAQEEMDRIAVGIRQAYAGWETSGYRINVTSMHQDLTAHVRPMVLALLGAVGFLLLIACANVANLLLVRAVARERELAVRAALGGSRPRLVAQLLVESAVLALLGGAVGLGLARAGMPLLTLLRPGELPRFDSIRIDGMVLAFTAAASGLAALIFGMAPALRAARPNLIENLKDRGHTAAAGMRQALGSAVVVSEVALSLILLIGAGLMIRSFVELQRVNPGYDPANVLTFGLNVPQSRYPTPAARASFGTQLRERMAGLPGVTAVGAAFPLPLGGQVMNGRYGGAEAIADPTLFRQADYRVVVPGYFEAMGTRLLAGRTFTEADLADSAATVVVDRKLAERMWPAQSAVGQRLVVRLVSQEPEWVEVIGVVEHQRRDALREEGLETVFFNDRYAGGFGLLTWTVRADRDPQDLVRAIQQEVAALDANIPLGNVRPMEAYVAQAMSGTRFVLLLIGIFGAAALLLAIVGLYGVLSYAVRQRRAEIGVRMALGADAGSIMHLVVGRGLRLTAVGLALGLAGAFALTRGIEGLLVGVAPTDPATFAAIPVLFLVVAAVACYLPARRAMRVDPATVLREG
jgi:putative ABC transport system permease protein